MIKCRERDSIHLIVNINGNCHHHHHCHFHCHHLPTSTTFCTNSVAQETSLYTCPFISWRGLFFSLFFLYASILSRATSPPSEMTSELWIHLRDVVPLLPTSSQGCCFLTPYIKQLANFCLLELISGICAVGSILIAKSLFLRFTSSCITSYDNLSGGHLTPGNSSSSSSSTQHQCYPLE